MKLCELWDWRALGFQNTAGEYLKYLVHSRDGQPLTCLLFGAAAFKCGARCLDRLVGTGA